MIGGLPRRIFLAYAHADATELAPALYRALTGAGHEVWWDQVSLPRTSDDLLRSLRAAVLRTDCMIVLLGPRAIASPFVRFEWSCALAAGKPVLGVLANDCADGIPRAWRVGDKACGGC